MCDCGSGTGIGIDGGRVASREEGAGSEDSGVSDAQADERAKRADEGLEKYLGERFSSVPFVPNGRPVGSISFFGWGRFAAFSAGGCSYSFTRVFLCKVADDCLAWIATARAIISVTE